MTLFCARCKTKLGTAEPLPPRMGLGWQNPTFTVDVWWDPRIQAWVCEKHQPGPKTPEAA